MHCSPYRYCICYFARYLQQTRFFERRRCSAWQRHSWDVCHTPAEFLSRLLKVGNDSESSQGHWLRPIEFYNFSLLILKVLVLWFLKDCKHLWEEGLVVLAQTTNVAFAAAHLLRCQGPALNTDKPSSGKYLPGKIFSFFSQRKEFLYKLVNLWQAPESGIIPLKLLFFCFNFLRNSVEGFC